MNRRSAILIAAILLLLVTSQAQSPALKFVKKIGFGWPTDKWGWMSFVAFSPDGTMVASDGPATPNGAYGNLTIWSFPDGRLIREFSVQPIAISDDWKYFAGPHSVSELQTGKTIISLGKKDFAGFAFSPDSRYVAESLPGHSVRDSSIRIVDLATGKQTNAFGMYAPFSMAISPDGGMLAAGYWNKVAIWNVVTGKRVALLSGFARYVYGLSFSRDGKLLAAGNDVGELQIWDVNRQVRLHAVRPAGGYSYVSNPAFSPDGRLVAVGIYGTGSVFLIDVNTGKLLDHQLVSGIGCGSVAFSPDGRFLITPSTGGLIKWPYDQGGTIRVFEVHAP